MSHSNHIIHYLVTSYTGNILIFSVENIISSPNLGFPQNRGYIFYYELWIVNWNNGRLEGWKIG